MGQRGFFITFEGPDGGGKSSQIRRLANGLKQKGYTVITTREPGGTPISDQIREIILNPAHKEMDAITEALLYAAARAQHVAEVIRPAIAAGKVVLCDRFVDSSIAYQGHGRGITMPFVKQINEMATGNLKPDLTILLDLPVEIGLTRAKKGGLIKGDRLEQEKLEFHQRVREAYLHLAKEEPDRFRIVDASEEMEKVYHSIVKILQQAGLRLG